ncbi:MAG: TonB-dependent receptor [Chitinophagales bacterium]
MIRYITFLLIVFFAAFLHAQDGKNVRGQVVDKDSKFPIAGANVVVPNSSPFLGTVTDENGYFLLAGVPLGRVNIKVSFVGYKDAFMNEVLVMAGKETQLNIELEEKVRELKEVVVKAESDKGRAKNEFATVSARSFDVEQTNKFSGSRNDPARMASNFAGVSGANDARNDIIIRGNSPLGLLWRLEGVDIPSPNHFASFGSTGGPVSMLNNNTLMRSDFFTAAFPSEYGNALAGVFDLKMRSGNKDKYEFMAQIGFNGLEVGAEGPFAKKKSAASWMINYRYSTLALFKLMGANFGTGTAVPYYQDLSFKVDVPTKKAGVFRLFGLGGLSSIELLGSKTDVSKKGTDLYGNENQDLYNHSRTGILGFSHTYFLDSKSYFRTTIAASHQLQKVEIDTINLLTHADKQRYNNVFLQQNKYSAHLVYNRKINSRNTIVAGVNGNVYDVFFKDSVSYGGVFLPIKYGKGISGLVEAYATWQHKFGERLVMNLGLHGQYFTLSKSVAPEPRLGLRYQLNEKMFLSFGYGLHHEIQPLPTYYNHEVSLSGTGASTNLNMGFSRSNHVVLGYDLVFLKDFHFKTEAYFQYIDRVPVSDTVSSFSMLNAGSQFSTPNNNYLKNRGIGRNYGLEITMEKFFTRGYYFLVTGSFFQSEYQGSDKVWRNTAFNGHYVVNALGGYEYKFGGKKNKTKKYSIAADGKLTGAGGRYYTPVDLAASAIARKEVDIEGEAFSKKYADYFRLDLKISFRISLRKMTHEFSFDVQNVTNRKNVFRISYNPRTNALVTEYQQGLFPLPQYRIYF